MQTWFQLQDELSELPPLMAEKGCGQPKAELIISSEAGYRVNLRNYGGSPIGTYDMEIFSGDVPEKLLTRARNHILALPSKENLVLQKYLKTIAKAVDVGRDDDIQMNT